MLDKLENFLAQDNVFLSGGAGVGKSYLTNQLKLSYRNKGRNVIALGSSALSAFNVGGVTLHSFFCFGRCENALELSIYDRKQREKLVKLYKILKKVDLIIIDEISMVSASVFDMIALRIKNSLFNGKILVVGDFFQLPPIAKQKQNSLFVNSYYAFSSFFWQELSFKNLKLSLAKRTQNSEFYKQLSYLREGKLNLKNLEYFQNLCMQTKDLCFLEEDYTLLCGINKKANAINEEKLIKIDSPLYTFKAQFKIEDEDLTQDQVLSWFKSLNILEELKIKIGARIIFCLNHWEQNYYNGEQGVVEQIIEEEDKIYIRIRKNNGICVMLEPYSFLMEELEQKESDFHVKIRASVMQFPIKLAYAITIHKSQGMSIEKLVCDIDHIFENGQLYVALSRAIDPNYLKIYYSRAKNFLDYFYEVSKISEEVVHFYNENSFLDLELYNLS